jgi:hypothetical protein
VGGADGRGRHRRAPSPVAPGLTAGDQVLAGPTGVHLARDHVRMPAAIAPADLGYDSVDFPQTQNDGVRRARRSIPARPSTSA